MVLDDPCEREPPMGCDPHAENHRFRQIPTNNMGMFEMESSQL